jgi:hypothetical protein
MLKLNAHARIEIALVTILLLSSCDSLPANFTRGDSEKLEMADVNARNAIYKVNALESRVEELERKIGS